MKINHTKRLLIIGTVALGIQACNSGSNNSTPGNTTTPENYIGMPVTATVCYSAKFFSPESLVIESSFGSSQFCIPYLKDESKNLQQSVIESVVHYYYGIGATLASSCPAVAKSSEMPFPDNSQYNKEMTTIEAQASSCAVTRLSSQSVLNPMFVFDIDDTLTSGYIADCQNGFAKYQPQVWQQAKESSAFVRTPQMYKLLQYAFSHNISVALVTGRPIAQYTMTVQNLITAYPEFESNINQLVSLGNLMLVPESEGNWTIDSFKNTARQELINKGYTIILNMGDQYSDLDYIYPYSNAPACSYKLPNYMYYIK